MPAGADGLRQRLIGCGPRLRVEPDAPALAELRRLTPEGAIGGYRRVSAGGSACDDTSTTCPSGSRNRKATWGAAETMVLAERRSFHAASTEAVVTVVCQWSRSFPRASVG